MDKGGSAMRKIIVDGYIVGVGDKENEITTDEYNTILEIISNKPIAPTGYTYKLKDNLEWEICKETKSGGM
jgi:hypothetical protein